MCALVPETVPAGKPAGTIEARRIARVNGTNGKHDEEPTGQSIPQEFLHIFHQIV